MSRRRSKYLAAARGNTFRASARGLTCPSKFRGDKSRKGLQGSTDWHRDEKLAWELQTNSLTVFLSLFYAHALVMELRRGQRTKPVVSFNYGEPVVAMEQKVFFRFLTSPSKVLSVKHKLRLMVWALF